MSKGITVRVVYLHGATLRQIKSLELQIAANQPGAWALARFRDALRESLLYMQPPHTAARRRGLFVTLNLS